MLREEWRIAAKNNGYNHFMDESFDYTTHTAVNIIKYYELTINIVNELHSLVCLMNEKLSLGPITYFWPSILSQAVGFIFDPWLCL